ncbi:MAG TPA: hypothetical protein VHZ56_06050, partial [Devosia sp.]|nr:hypothetical protein [Devosia sp.]
MSTSGPEALRALDEAVRDIRREEDEIARRLARSAELLTRLREQEGELLRQLVSARLDAAAQEQLARQASEAGARARQMLKAHGETLAAIDGQLTALDAAIAAAVTERAALQGEAARLDGELTALAGAVRPQIEADPTYAAKVETARQLAGVADEARQRADAGAAACDGEARAYRGDPLFSYLWARGYGTETYRANRFTAWLDSKIATRVDFDEKRPLFAVLNDIPSRLRDLAVRQQSEAEAAGAAVRAFEADALAAAGGTPARDGRAATVAGIGEIDGRVVILE